MVDAPTMWFEKLSSFSVIPRQTLIKLLSNFPFPYFPFSSEYCFCFTILHWDCNCHVVVTCKWRSVFCKYLEAFGKLFFTFLISWAPTTLEWWLCLWRPKKLMISHSLHRIMSHSLYRIRSHSLYRIISFCRLEVRKMVHFAFENIWHGGETKCWVKKYLLDTWMALMLLYGVEVTTWKWERVFIWKHMWGRKVQGSQEITLWHLCLFLG